MAPWSRTAACRDDLRPRLWSRRGQADRCGDAHEELERQAGGGAHPVRPVARGVGLHHRLCRPACGGYGGGGGPAAWRRRGGAGLAALRRAWRGLPEGRGRLSRHHPGAGARARLCGRDAGAGHSARDPGLPGSGAHRLSARVRTGPAQAAAGLRGPGERLPGVRPEHTYRRLDHRRLPGGRDARPAGPGPGGRPASCARTGRGAAPPRDAGAAAPTGGDAGLDPGARHDLRRLRPAPDRGWRSISPRSCAGRPAGSAASWRGWAPSRRSSSSSRWSC